MAKNNNGGQNNAQNPNQQHHEDVQQRRQENNAANAAAASSQSYMDMLMGMFNPAGSPEPEPMPVIDPTNAIRDQNPFASYSNALQQYGGINTNTKGDQFTDWVNSSGWADVQSDYKANINKNPFAQTGQGGDMYSFINNQGTGLVDSLRARYRAMVPQQRGINSAMSFKPGRWAVY